METANVCVFPSADELVEHAALTLWEACQARGSGPISVALSGGSTPALLYRRLAEGYRDSIPWDRLEVFFGDERAVPPDHPDSNYRLAFTTFLGKVAIPPERIHRMAGEEPDLEAAARRYEEEVCRSVPAGPDGVPSFDLIWLGIGEDGHTASLFPGTKALEEKKRLVAANEAPALKSRRLTFTLPLLNAAKVLQFIVAGKKKAPVVRRVLEAGKGAGSRPIPPAALVRPTRGELELLLDREAASEIEEAKKGG
jgi:6-phosphogluconolactonase